jgi:hypothetical protein
MVLLVVICLVLAKARRWVVRPTRMYLRMEGQEWYVDIQGSKVVAPCLCWLSPFLCRLRTVCSGTLGKHLICNDCMKALWDLANWCNSMIVVVGRYPTTPLEMFSGIVYVPHTDSPVCGIKWKTCTRERSDSNQPYEVMLWWVPPRDSVGTPWG